LEYRIAVGQGAGSPHTVRTGCGKELKATLNWIMPEYNPFSASNSFLDTLLVMKLRDLTEVILSQKIKRNQFKK
jgi:hypothetical protein